MNSTQVSKISNVEWGLAIGALLMIDIIQVLLDWITVGTTALFINPFIDIYVAMGWGLYLQIRGEKLSDPKRAASLFAALLFEMIPGVGELPLWCLEGVYAMILSKRKVILNSVTPSVGVKPQTEKDDDETSAAA